MLYAFHNAVLKEDRYTFEVQNITLEIVEGTTQTETIKNECLNGKYNIKGVFDNRCLKSQNKIKTGNVYNLRLHNGEKWSILPVITIDLLGVAPDPNNKFFRVYTWMFCGVQKPLDDYIGLLPSFGNGEISLDDLLGMIGGSRGQMEREKKTFTAEGGFR